MHMKQIRIESAKVTIQAGEVLLEGNLSVPPHSKGIVLFAHGSGSSRHSPRNRFVADELNDAGLSTLLFDLLTTAEEDAEEDIDLQTHKLRFNIPLLAGRLVGAVDWVRSQQELQHMKIGLFGASTGAAAALIAAAERPDDIAAVISRGGRPDLAGDLLPQVTSPTLMIVGGYDTPVISMNKAAGCQMRTHHQLEIVPGASHLFEEPGTLEAAAHLAKEWFCRYL